MLRSTDADIPLPMKTTLPLLALTLFAVGCASATRPAPVADTRVYELRTYTATPGNLPKVIARFRDHTVRIFAKHGMVSVGYWTPADAKDGPDDKLVYLLAHASREAATASWAAFLADPEWRAVQTASEADGRIVARAESVFLAPSDYSPAFAPVAKGGGAARAFELRTYTVPPEKLAVLDARFRDHTLAFFRKHGMASVAYFHPLDANKGAATTLIYFLTYPSREAATASWAAFRANPEWIAIRAESERKDGLVAQTQSVFLTPTDFSPMR
jgi:hypothetical protein